MFAALILKEHYGISKFLMTFLSLGGAVLILKPEFFFGNYKAKGNPGEVLGVDSEEVFIGSLCLVAAACITSLMVVISKVIQ